MIATGRLAPGRIVTRTVGLHQASAVLESLETYGPTGVVVIDDFRDPSAP
ncbi:hypothetical protein [Streptomyces sp. Y1]|uniref:Uncharacterized protein n=1 Tax=Streptomyces sp. Y1 TaxID=3238634 RepID=A0AB39TVU0_9ACTN